MLILTCLIHGSLWQQNQHLSAPIGAYRIVCVWAGRPAPIGISAPIGAHRRLSAPISADRTYRHLSSPIGAYLRLSAAYRRLSAPIGAYQHMRAHIELKRGLAPIATKQQYSNQFV